jgi:TPR repeat protein
MTNRLYDEAARDPELRALLERAEKGRTSDLWALWRHCHDRQDYLRSLPLLRRLAERGIAAALLNLGYYHEHGLGTQTDYRKAMDLYGRAADKGDTTAMINLGKLYARFTGSWQHQAKARDLFERAAELGDPEAMYCMGERLYHGPAAPQDKTEAVKWLERAAAKGFLSAAWRLLYHYRENFFEPRDPGGAVRCLRLLADAGYPEQQLACGIALFRGDGAGVDLPEAYYWLLLAVRHGCSEGKPDLRLCGAFLTRSVRRGQAAKARAWQEKHAHLKEILRDWAEKHRRELADKSGNHDSAEPLRRRDTLDGDRWRVLYRRLCRMGVRVPRFGVFLHRKGKKPEYVEFPEE